MAREPPRSPRAPPAVISIDTPVSRADAARRRLLAGRALRPRHAASRPPIQVMSIALFHLLMPAPAWPPASAPCCEPIAIEAAPPIAVPPIGPRPPHPCPSARTTTASRARSPAPARPLLPARQPRPETPPPATAPHSPLHVLDHPLGRRHVEPRQQGGRHQTHVLDGPHPRSLAVGQTPRRVPAAASTSPRLHRGHHRAPPPRSSSTTPSPNGPVGAVRWSRRSSTSIRTLRRTSTPITRSTALRRRAGTSLATRETLPVTAQQSRRGTLECHPRSILFKDHLEHPCL